MKRFICALLLLIVGTACSRNFNGATSQNFTLGAVQMKIHRGMSQTDVAQALGSPNIVTQDSEGSVAWVYDKVGTEVEYYDRGGGFWLVIVGAGGSHGGTKTSQRTLTAVVKFDSHRRVENVTYHSSKF